MFGTRVLSWATVLRMCRRLSSTAAISPSHCCPRAPVSRASVLTRRPSARAVAIIVLPGSSGARMLPKPKYTGGAPASRKVSNPADSGRRSGRVRRRRSGTLQVRRCGHGASAGPAASHGVSVNMWLRARGVTTARTFVHAEWSSAPALSKGTGVRNTRARPPKRSRYRPTGDGEQPGGGSPVHEISINLGSSSRFPGLILSQSERPWSNDRRAQDQ